MLTFRRRHSWWLLQLGVALGAVACSNKEEPRTSAHVDTAAAVQRGAPNSRPTSKPSPAAPIAQPAVFYVEATASEIEAARKGVSPEDFAVIADDLMFYRSSALERLEEWHIPVARVTGRRPIQFTVNGTPETIDFKDATTLDFIVVYRTNVRPRIFAPNEIDEVRRYWQSGSTARDSTDQSAAEPRAEAARDGI